MTGLYDKLKFERTQFCSDDFTVYLVTPTGFETRTLAQLLPDSFSL